MTTNMWNTWRASIALGALAFSVAGVHALPAQVVTPKQSPVLVAQTFPSCAPGAAFLITGFRTAAYGVANPRDSAHTVYSFGAELIVVDVEAASLVRAGDVIVAVNGNPITTRAGADQFVYPAAGTTVLSVRRGGENIEIRAAPARYCGGDGRYSFSRQNAAALVGTAAVRLDSLRGAIGGGRGGVGGRGGASAGGVGRGGGRGGGGAGAGAVTDTAAARRLSWAADSLLRYRIVPSAAKTTLALTNVTTSTVPLLNFGVTLQCRPATCTRERLNDGTTYWRFDGYPAVGAMVGGKDGLAERAGLQEGDIIITVNGLSPMTPEGALLLDRADRELKLTLEVSRGGKREKVTLKL